MSKSRRPRRFICVVVLLLTGLGCCWGAEGGGGVYRLYDFTPVSGTNPVVASVKDCGIEIPASEFRAFVQAMPPPNGDESKRPRTLTTEQKRANLDRLVDEHLLMWEGYQQKADQTPFIAHLLEITKGMLMRETLVNETVKGKAKTAADFDRIYKELCDRLFNQTDITVSNEAYGQVKELLKGPSNPDLSKLPPGVGGAVFAEWKGGVVTTGDLLAFYMKLPQERRPNLLTHDGVEQMLEQMLEDRLLNEEAQARGLEDAPIVIEKLQLNRNKLCRMYVLNEIAAQAAQLAREPGEEGRVKQWYQQHLKDRYTYKDANGKEQVVPYATAYQRIENNYVDDLREHVRAQYLQGLRSAHPVAIDEKAMEEAIPGNDTGGAINATNAVKAP